MSEATKPITVVSCGDIEFEMSTTTVPSVGTEGVRAAFAQLKRADVCFINCEMPLTRGGFKQEKSSALRSDPALAQDLVALGAHVATLANNHMLDYSYPGLFETMETLDSAGIARVGAGRNLEEALRPHFQEVAGKRFAFLGLASTLPPGSAADDNRPGVAPIRVVTSLEMDPTGIAETPGHALPVRTRAKQVDLDRAAAAVAAARREADHVIVGIHWGVTRRKVTPLMGMIADYQPVVGHTLIDAGADVVLGHHSHCLLGVEVYRGGVIFYSLGNFIFQPWRTWMEPETVVAFLDFGGSSMGIRLVPVLINPDGFPEMPSDLGRDRIARLLVERSEQFGTEFDIGSEFIGVRLR